MAAATQGATGILTGHGAAANLDLRLVPHGGESWFNVVMEYREATQEEARRIEETEQRAFGYRSNPCQSIPPRHTPYTMSDGTIRCTTCGEELD